MYYESIRVQLTHNFMNILCGWNGQKHCYQDWGCQFVYKLITRFSVTINVLECKLWCVTVKVLTTQCCVTVRVLTCERMAHCCVTVLKCELMTQCCVTVKVLKCELMAHCCVTVLKCELMTQCCVTVKVLKCELMAHCCVTECWSVN